MDELTNTRELIDYIGAYSRNSFGVTDVNCQLDHILRFWRENKSEYLYKLLGNKFMVSKSIEFTKRDYELQAAMSELLDEFSGFVEDFKSSLKKALEVKYLSQSLFGSIVSGIFTPEELSYGKIYVSVCGVLNGVDIKLSKGQKSMRALGRVAKTLGLEDAFEEFRLAHSRVLNQKSIKGNLVLSIHPMDYATASDNACGWTSCLSWSSDGCYQMGTVEMMNSPMVICAYVTSTIPFELPDGRTWPSKKWRAWVIVTKDLIVVDKNYPYQNTELSCACVDWVKELAATNLGWKYQDKEVPKSENDCGRIMNSWDFTTRFMYNDFNQSNEFAYGAIGCDVDASCSHRLNFSGPANCMVCGEEVVYGDLCDEDYSGSICCEHCRGVKKCCICQYSISDTEGSSREDDKGNIYCADCYFNKFNCISCDRCDEFVSNGSDFTVTFPIDTESLYKVLYKELPRTFHQPAYIELQVTLCHNCFSDLGLELATDFLDLVSSKLNCNYNDGVTYYHGYGLPDPKCITFITFRDLFFKMGTCNNYNYCATLDQTLLRQIWDTYTERINEIWH